MGKAKKKGSKIKRYVGSTPMDMDEKGRDPMPRQQGSESTAVPGPRSKFEGMDTSEVVVTGAGQKAQLGTAVGRVSKKKLQKRRKIRVRKERALMRALTIIDKEEQRVTKAGLKKFGKDILKGMD